MEPLSLAVCIPTYERCIVLEDFLNQCYENYTSVGIDIYIYDSSISNETLELFHKWEDRGHLYYVRMPSDMHPNVKAFRIFQGYGRRKEYDFLLLSSDAIIYSKETIRTIVNQLSAKYNIISIGCSNDKGNAVCDYTDPNEYLLRCAYNMATFGRVILNVRTMLHNVDWQFYEKIYLSEPLIPWSHIGFYFRHITELTAFQGKDIPIPQSAVRYSLYKKSSCWSSDFIPFLCEGWVQVIESLPSCYIHKGDVIREQGEKDLPNVKTFIQLRRKGQFSLRVLIQYRDGLKKITPVPRSALFLVALLPAGTLNLWRGLVFRRKLSSLKRFCESHPETLIYGKGTQGYLYGKCLLDHGIKPDGFCVSHPAAEGETFMECPVYEFAGAAKKHPEAGYIVGVAPGNASEVVKNLQGAVKKSQIFFDLDFANEIRYQYGYGFVAIK